MAKTHDWQRCNAQDNQGRQYHAFLCGNCEYLVVAARNLVTKVEHFPEHRLVCLPQEDLTLQDVRDVCDTLKIDCD